MVKENYVNVEKRVSAACERAGRNRSEVTLIAVSKTKPIELLQEAYQAGAREYGENKVQEICEKYPQMPHDVKWHMIGHLQRNKVKQVIDKASLIHSVDSIRLAEEISKEAVKHNLTAHILIEVNVAEEETKFGVHCEDTLDLIKDISKLPNIRIDGLMTIAPYVVNSEENRPIFHKIRDMAVDIASQNIDNVSMDILSMGMSGDFEVAIEEGATHVRVGTSIFGERNYNI